MNCIPSYRASPFLVPIHTNLVYPVPGLKRKIEVTRPALKLREAIEQ
ncbi:MAG: hypothetical protein M3Z26_10470 [Bacteroidota bacterium]|nr:hypothetical protein [Bacteroidota bacterium]